MPKPVSTGAAADPAAAQDPNDRAWARLRYHDDDLLTVAQAARLSGRSVRTLRRAYLSSRLIAHRDGNGRGVSIRYGDLQAWLTAQVIRAAPEGAMARADVRSRAENSVQTGNLELLTALLQRRGTRARAVPRPAVRQSAALRP